MTRSDFFQRSLGKNLPLKGLALVLALTLWFHISRTGREYFSLTVPVNVVNLPSRLALKRSSPDHATLTLEGPPGFGQRLHTENLSIMLDGRSFTQGHRTVLLTNKSLALPTGVSVIRISPRIVVLNLLPLTQKTVRILPQLIGETRHRIASLRVRLVPEVATIEGDTKGLAAIHFLKTTPIELSQLAGGKTQSFNISIAIPDSSHIRLITPQTVRVEISQADHFRSIDKR